MNEKWKSFIADLAQKNDSLVFIPLLKKTFLTETSDNQASLSCENLGTKIFLETKKKELEAGFSNWMGKTIAINLIIQKKTKKTQNINTPLIFEKNTNLNKENRFKSDLIGFRKTGLQPGFTFDNFAVSSSNQIAYTAGLTVAKNISAVYNPLFIYGGVGVGKTHLTQAIGHKLLQKNNDRNVLYCTSEEFTNDLIECIKAKNTGQFRRKYRLLNALLIDDIQFIAGKNYIQEELYHTFNTIIKNRGQIVLTSDRPPKEISKLEDRLRSRFAGGLAIDIQKPDIELRSAILLIKAQDRNIEIDIEAAKLIAENVDDARELEGKLLEIYARLAKNHEKILPELIKNELAKKNEQISAKVFPQDVIKTVCSFYHVKPSQIKSSSRRESAALPRQIIMFILRNKLKLKYEETAFILKKKDHTTIMHGVEKITNLMVKNPVFKEEIDRIVNSLNSST